MAKDRSPNYPAIGVTDAIELVRTIHEKEGRTVMSMEQAARALGYTSLSGRPRTQVSALKKYGLLAAERGGLRVSDLARQILLSALGSSELKAALREAALKPELFRELAESHPEASTATIVSHLQLRKGFSASGAATAAQTFHEAIMIARGAKDEYEEEEIRGQDGGMDGSIGSEFGEVRAPARQVRVFSVPLAKNLLVEVKFTGAELRPAHIVMLRDYLALIERALNEEHEILTSSAKQP